MYVLIIRNYSYLEEKVLIANRSQGHSFILNGQTFFCFNCLVESVTPTPPLTFKKSNVIIMPSKNLCDCIMQQDRRMRQRERERERLGKARKRKSNCSFPPALHKITLSPVNSQRPCFQNKDCVRFKKNGVSLNKA